MSKEMIGEKVLFIGVSIHDQEQINTAFSRHGRNFSPEFVSTAEAGLELIKSRVFKAVFVAQTLPGMDGLLFPGKLNILKIQVPVIIMTESEDEYLALKALREGAYECVYAFSGSFDRLPASLDRALARYDLNREKAEVEKAITESKKQWTALFDGITDFIFMTDSEHRIIRSNLALASTFGRHPKEIIGLKFSDLFGANISETECIEKNSSRQCTEEKTINDETYLISSFPIYYKKMHQTIYVMKNITEMKRLKEQLYHSDKLASIGLLTAGVAHEINNPLTGIIAYTELLKMKFADGEIQRELKKVYDSAERCKKIVDTLMTFSMQKTPSKSLESINDIIDRAIVLRSYWLRSNNIDVLKEYENATVYVDSQQLQQVMLAILINAEQAIVNTGRKDGAVIFASKYDRDDHKVTIKITDNGHGIPRKIITMIFDPFFTTKPAGAGTGLGLSIAHGIITEHGGNIKVESSENKGAVFTIELPTGIGGRHVLPDFLHSDESKQINKLKRTMLSKE